MVPLGVALIGGGGILFGIVLLLLGGSDESDLAELPGSNAHLSITSRDPHLSDSYIFAASLFTGQAVVIELDDYGRLQGIIDPVEPITAPEEELAGLTVRAYEIDTTEIQMLLTNDSAPGSPTAVLERLDLEVVDVAPLESPHVLRYVAGGATGKFRVGYVAYKGRGRYPVRWLDTTQTVGAIVPSEELPPRFLTLAPGDVEGMTIVIQPEESAKPGIYTMRFVAVMRIAGERGLVYSDLVFRAAVLGVPLSEASGDVINATVVEALRDRAYVKPEEAQ